MQKKVLILILAVILVFTLSLARDFIIKSLIGTVATGVTGAPTRIGGFSLSLIRQSVKISNFRMYNPADFPPGILVDIPKINAVYDMAALFAGKIHLRRLDMYISEVGMIKNKYGKLNVNSLKMMTGNRGEQEKNKPAKQLPMQIDSVTLEMNRVVSKDYSVGDKPVVKVYDIDFKKTYKNITSAQQLTVLSISEPLKAAGIEGVEVYGVAAVAGVAVLPVAAAFTFAGKDYAQEVFNVTPERAYDAGLHVIKMAGKITQENRSGGIISAEVDGARLTFKLRKISNSSVQVTISARKFGFPQAAIASGVMYRLREQLK